MSARLLTGDCRALLPTLADCSIDAIVTDPPAGIGFMGKDWDDFRRARNDADAGRDNVFGRTSARGPEYARKPREAFIAFLTQVMTECLRVLKPGGHALVWAIPRTSHWTATACEDAGFEIRDKVFHLFGSGFPKSLDVSKAIDKAAGAQGEVVGIRSYAEGHVQHSSPDRLAPPIGTFVRSQDARLAPATDAAKQWSGFGTSLKPAVQEWILCRKPLVGTVAENVQRYGTGALNIDGCRIGFVSAADESESKTKNQHADFGSGPMTNAVFGKYKQDRENYNPPGRWPAHLTLSHTEECERIGTTRVKTAVNNGSVSKPGRHAYNPEGWDKGTPAFDFADADGMELVDRWRCTPDCPVRMLDEQAGETGAFAPVRGTEPSVPGYSGGLGRHVGAPFYADTGGPSRFFYTAKASRSERNIGLQNVSPRRSDYRPNDNPDTNCLRTRLHGSRLVQNSHPTVKPIALMRWLCRLITPPGGTVLDPFMGSGSTGIAASREGFDFIGIEQSGDYVAMAEQRIQGDAPLLAQVSRT